MMTRKIIKNIVPTALPLAILLISVASPHHTLAADNAKKATGKTSQEVKDNDIAPSEGATDTADADQQDAKPSKKGKSSKNKSPKEKDKDTISESEKDAGNDSARVKELVYNEANVYVIRTKYGYQTNIVFDPKEEVQTISVGDRSLWQIIPSGNRLFIRPMTENISTNMTLLTNKHSYEFDLKSVPAKNESNVYVVRFTYPEKIAPLVDNYAYAPTSVAAAYTPVQTLTEPKPVITPEAPKLAAPEVASPSSIGLLPIRYNYSYTYAGPDALAPLQVYDDGKSTFIKYKEMAKKAPAVYSIDSSGKETPVAATVKGPSLVIDNVASELALRSSDGEIRVYNESLSPR